VLFWLAPSVFSLGRTPAIPRGRDGVGAPPHWQPIPLRSIDCQCGGSLSRAVFYRQTFTPPNDFKLDMKNQDLIAFQLSNSQPEAVFEWLENNLPKKVTPFGNDRHELEVTLLRLNNPLVKMGLARFGIDKEVAKEIYATGEPLLRKAVISGPSISAHFRSWLDELNIVKSLLAENNKELLFSLLSSTYLPFSIFRDLYERRGDFKDLEDEFFLDLIGSSLNSNFPYIFSEGWVRAIINPGSNFDTEGIELDFTDIYKRSQLAWALFESLPTTPRAAAVLSGLSHRILRAPPCGLDIFKNIEKWKTPTGIEQEYQREWFEECRTALGSLLESEKLKNLCNNDDPALRKSYYSFFEFEDPSELKKLKKKDRKLFIYAALDNAWLYRSLNFREALFECCRGFFATSDFNWRSKQISQIVPHWYFDEIGEGKLYTGHIENPIEAQLIRIIEIEKSIKRISNFLMGGDVDCMQDRTVQEIIRNQSEIKLKLKSLYNYMIAILLILIWLALSK
jgi:hypothetical protein